MPIKNYTTQVNMHKTISEIEEILTEHGVVHINKIYEKGTPVALYFTYPYEHEYGEEMLNFKLPAKWEAVYQVLKEDKKVTGKYETKEQALRVSWRILKDWIDSQMALLQTDMVKMEQIFLPYMTDPQGITVYERFKEQQFKALTGETV